MTSSRTPAPCRSPSRAVALLLALAIAALALAAPVAAAPRPGLLLTTLEPDFMCQTCHEPLNVAQSLQAASERSYLSGLIARGETKTQIENAMVAVYGPTVLSEPRATGFNVALYILPPALVLAGLASLAVLLPRWRRRAQATAGQDIPAGPELTPADSERLEEELARYDG